MNKEAQYQAEDIFYKTEGKGFPVFLIHGFCEDHTVWDEFKKPLLDRYKIITPDLPGFGKTKLKGATEIEGMADAVKSIADKEKLSKIILIGHSMGGYVTLAFAEKYPELLSGFALFHSICFPDDEVKKVNRKKVADFVLKNGTTLFMKELYDTLFSKEFISLNTELVNGLVSHFSTFSPEGIANASLAMSHRPDRSFVLKESSVPVLFIVGKQDGVFKLERSMQMVHLPEVSEAILLENTVHMGMFEEREKSQQAVLNWLNSR